MYNQSDSNYTKRTHSQQQPQAGCVTLCLAHVAPGYREEAHNLSSRAPTT